jgi:hypothetical protein
VYTALQFDESQPTGSGCCRLMLVSCLAPNTLTQKMNTMFHRNVGWLSPQCTVLHNCCENLKFRTLTALMVEQISLWLKPTHIISKLISFVGLSPGGSSYTNFFMTLHLEKTGETGFLLSSQKHICLYYSCLDFVWKSNHGAHREIRNFW